MVKQKTRTQINHENLSDLVSQVSLSTEGILKKHWQNVVASPPKKEFKKALSMVVYTTNKLSDGKVSKSSIGVYLGGLSSSSISRNLKRHTEILKTDSEYQDSFKEFFEDVQRRTKMEKIVFV